MPELLAPQPHRLKQTYEEFNTTIVKFENGNEQRFCNHEEEIPGFKLSWNLLNKTEQVQLRDFFRARRGSFQSFWLNNHQEITGYVGGGPVYKRYTVRFKEDKLTFSHTNDRFANCECEVVVCL